MLYFIIQCHFKKELIFMAFDGLMTTIVAEELKTELLGGRINKIYQLSNQEILILVRANRKNQKLLLSTHSMYARAALTKLDYHYPDEPPMFCMFLRKQLEGAIITSVDQIQQDRIIRFTLRHTNEIGDQTIKHLIIEVMGKHSNLILCDQSGKILDCIKHLSPFMNRHRALQPGSSYILPPSQYKLDGRSVTLELFSNTLTFNSQLDKQIVANFKGFSPLLAKEVVHRTKGASYEALFKAFNAVLTELYEHPTPQITFSTKEVYSVVTLSHLDGNRQTFATLTDMFDRYYFGKEDRDRIKQQFFELERFIRQEYDKNFKKLEKLTHDLENTEKADIYKVQGELLLANLYQIKRGDVEVSVQNYYSPDLEMMTIALDPALSASDNAQKYFQRYNKAKNGVHYIIEQLEKTEAEILYFETLSQQINSATIKDALEIKEELENNGYLRKRLGKRKKQSSRPTFETYLSPDGVEILVGKNNIQNDYLTHKHAKRFEWWAHAKDMPGSHVIIRSDADELSEATIRSAAQLAAYFSKGRDSSSVPIDYTRVKNVKKIPAAHLGFVTYDQQKTIYIDPDESLILALEKKKN